MPTGVEVAKVAIDDFKKNSALYAIGKSRIKRRVSIVKSDP